MSNVIRFRDRVAVFNVNRVHEASLKRNATGLLRHEAARPILIAVWRRNPTSGRLECRWRSEARVCADEAGSRGARAA